MTLKEKLYEYSGDPLDCNPTDQKDAQNLVKITDDYAFNFADWLNNGRFSQYGNSWIDPRKNKDKEGDWLFFSSKQLLETYKKEKGL